MRWITASALLALIAAPSFGQPSRPGGVLPVAGSTPGAFQSNFVTSLQLHNRGTAAARGVLVFHRNGQPAAPDDPALAYEIAPRQTVHYDDVLGSMGITGLGTVDVVPLEGEVPAAMARAFNRRADGTEGMAIPLMDPRDALRPGVRATLLVPPDLAQFRFNIGIRSLAAGADVRFTVFGANGVQRASGARSFTPDTLEQRPAAEMLGTALLAGDSISFEVVGGTALIYGTTTDNVSNDPSLQTASVAEAL